MMTIEELAEKIGARAEGDAAAAVSGVCPLDDVRDGCVTFIEKQRDAAKLQDRSPAAVICSDSVSLEGFTLLRAGNPKLAFALALRIFHPARGFDPGIHPSAVVDPGALIDPTATVGPNCCVESGVVIGAGTVLRANVFVGRGATIGEDCVLHPNVTVLDDCALGDRVILHGGVVIGADGFGYVQDGARHFKMPQVGRVVIENDVEIGANSAVDRATLGETRIGSGTKIDNLVQVGHNVNMGKNCIICGQVGISGSVTIGDSVIMGGQAGVSDHVTIGDGAMLGGKSGVVSDVPAGKFYSGFPARRHRDNMIALSALDKLPGLIKKLEAETKKGGCSEGG